MSQRTNIHYCDSSLNLMMGCDGCELWDGETVKDCYAGNLIGRHAGQPGWPASFDRPELFTHRLDAALKWPDLTGKPRPEKPWLDGYPRIIFVDDLGDTWTHSLPDGWLAPLLPKMADSPHIWLFCTKRPVRAGVFFSKFPAPRNLWLLTTVTGPTSLGRIPALLDVPGISVRGLSLEPLWGMPDLLDIGQGRSALTGWTWNAQECIIGGPKIDWIAIGGQSGPKATPCDISWIHGLLRQAKAAGTPAFVKQLGARPFCGYEIGKANPLGGEDPPRFIRLKDGHGADWSEWPEDLRVRQMPNWEVRRG